MEWELDKTGNLTFLIVEGFGLGILPSKLIALMVDASVEPEPEGVRRVQLVLGIETARSLGEALLRVADRAEQETPNSLN
jgi:hypothetical protein